MAESPGFPVVLTADRILMADQRVLLDAMLAAAQTSRVPGWVMRRVLARRMPGEAAGPPPGRRAHRAPLGLRRLEAALLAGGFDPDEVIVIAPEDLPQAVGPATRVVGVSSGDPLGLGMMTSTMEGLSGGEAYTARWFRWVMRRIARLRAKFPFRVLAGGPGAWQLEARPEARADLGIDTVFLGYAEREGVEVIHRVAEGGSVAPVVRGQRATAAEIPAIHGAASLGAVEVSRGCGRGCDFCTMRDEPMVHLPRSTILADVQTNVRGGAENISLLSEDFFRYGSSGTGVSPEALIDLVQAVRGVAGVRLIQLDHVSVASAAQLDDSALRTIHDVLVEGQRHKYLWVNIGVESASGPLVAAASGGPAGRRPGSASSASGRAKMHPITPEDWEEACEATLRRLIAAGFVPMVSLILGLPGERVEDVERTQAFVDRLRDERLVVFPIFYAPVGPKVLGFGMADMTPAHWRLVRRCYRLNFRWIPRMVWDNERGGGAPRARSVLIQVGGRLQALELRLRFILKSGRWRG